MDIILRMMDFILTLADFIIEQWWGGVYTNNDGLYTKDGGFIPIMMTDSILNMVNSHGEGRRPLGSRRRGDKISSVLIQKPSCLMHKSSF